MKNLRGVGLVMVALLGLAGCGELDGPEVRAADPVDRLWTEGKVQVMLPVQVRIELRSGGVGDHELVEFNPETGELALAGVGERLSMGDIVKLERNRREDQGVVLGQRSKIRGPEMGRPETWEVPLGAMENREGMIEIRGREVWDDEELRGKLERQNGQEFVLEWIVPLSEDEVEIMVSGVGRMGGTDDAN
ncbi:hypothetical protein VB712_00480 [Spirulina sp. CCNP1310]|uniref:hypothetical protein n=1 Tax=Spirulina sp. CCNP1310 TaxID=3110249 RepID=UPI002B20232C|nr:hypothetical protein [Spirulina sp. CCNP1310]MEA5417677.1 hypothetical protein [Spirulina sp. CCNP1310]